MQIFSLVKLHAKNTYRGNCGKAPRIRNHRTKVVSIIIRLFGFTSHEDLHPFLRSEIIEGEFQLGEFPARPKPCGESADMAPSLKPYRRQTALPRTCH